MSERDNNPTDPLESGQADDEASGADESSEASRRPRRLLRSRDDRMIAGVAGGLGRYFAVDPVIVRIAFAVSVFFGGLGALAYIALALFVPAGDSDAEVADAAPIERSRGLAIGAGIGLVVIALSWGIFDGGWGWHGGWLFGPPALLILIGIAVYLLVRRDGNQGSSARTVGGVIAAAAIAILAFGVLSAAAVASAWAGATGHGVAVAAVIVGLGALLILAAFRGGARWLIVPALVLAIPLAGVAAADISFGDGVGSREYEPATVAEIPADGYELGIGRLAVDLRELDWHPDRELALDVDLGIGEAVVAVPSTVCVSADVSARAGRVEVAGTESDGLDAELETGNVAASGPQLDLHGEIDLGQIRVVNDDNVEIDDHGPWNRDDGFDGGDELEAALDAACSPDRGRAKVGKARSE